MRGTRRVARRAAVLAVVVVASALAVAGPADAAEIWWWPDERVPGSPWIEPTHDGRVFTLEERHDIGNALVRIQSLDGRWAPQTRVLPSGVGALQAIEPVTTRTATYLVWIAESPTAGHYRLGASRLAGTAWEPLPVVDVPGAHLDVPDRYVDLGAGANAAGQLTVAVREALGPVEATIFDGDSWAGLETIGGEAWHVGHGLTAAVTEDGTSVVGYSQTPAGAGYGNKSFAVVHGAGGWGEPSELTAAHQTGKTPRLHAAGRDVVALFAAPSTGSGETFVRRLSSGSWSPRVNLGWGAVAMAGAPGAEATIVQLLDAHRDVHIQTRSSRPGGLTAPTLVHIIPNARQRSGTRVHAAVAADGTAAIAANLELAASYSSHYDHPRLMLIGRRGTGPWTPPMFWPTDDNPGASTTETPTVAVDAYGYIHVGWWHQAPYYRMAMVSPFGDLQPSAFYAIPAIWAYDVGLSTGVGGSDQFQPDRSITRAEAITALWRLDGSPTGAPASGFADVAPNAFYTRAVNWARAEGYTTGVGGANVFHPDRTITRSELVTLLWRAAGSPGAPASGFEDVPVGAFYERAVAWARHSGITTGVGGTNRFEPNRSITRGETFTLIYRFVGTLSAHPASGETTPRPTAELLGAATAAN